MPIVLWNLETIGSQSLVEKALSVKGRPKYFIGRGSTLQFIFEDTHDKSVKLRLALEKISELENLVPTEKEIEDKFKEYAESYKIDVEKIKTLIPQKDLILDLSCEKAMDFLRDNAKIS